MHSTRRARRGKRRLRIEPLEDRAVPAHAHGPDPLYAPGTPPEYMAEHPDALPSSEPSVEFQAVDKWTATVTNGTVSAREPVVLTWGIVPDGMTLSFGAGGAGEANTPSNLRAFLDGLYGNGGGGPDLTTRPWFPLIRDSLNRLAAVSGLMYVYQPADDGASFPGSPGAAGTRADVRIGGHAIDGAFNILAYNFFPNGGDMVIDTGDAGVFGSLTNGSRAMRNVIMHEQGHGVGLAHEGPVNSNTLMEPTLATNFDGPQFDDILGLHRIYGDVNEKGSANATPATATGLGSLAIGGTITRGASGNTTGEITGTSATDFASIDDVSDTDVYSVTVAANALFTAVLTPVGPTYQSGPANTNGPYVSFNATQQSNLTLAVLDSGGGVLVTANAGGLGAAEAISNVFSGSGGGTFYIRVTGANAAAQMYQLRLTAAPAGATVSVVGSDLVALGTSVDNVLTVRLSGANYRITDPFGPVAGPGATQVDALTVDVPVASIGGVIDVRGNDGNDSLVLDLSGGNVAPPGGLVFTGGNGTDTLVGPNAAAAWGLTAAGGGTLTAAGATPLTYAGMENLTGGSQADGFTFAGGGLAGAIDGGGGSDAVTADGGGRAFAISAANAGTVASPAVVPFSNVESVRGGAGADTFTFTGAGAVTGVDGGGGNDSLFTPDAGYTFTLTGPDAGSVSTLAAGFVSVETLVGGAGVDRLVIQGAGSLTGPFDGRGGADAVDLAGLAGGQAVTVTALGGVDGFDLGVVPAVGGAVLNVNSVIGSAGSDSLIGRDAATTWTVTAANAGTYTDDGSGRTFGFTAVETLAGGTGADLFQFAGGSLTGPVSGGAGSDTVAGDNTGRTFAVTGADAGTIGTLLVVGFTGVESLRGGSAGDAFTFGAAGSLGGTVNGGAGLDIVTGNDGALTYTLTGADAGTVSTILPGGFLAIENLTAGTGADTFQFNAGGSLSGAVNAGAGADLLVGDDAARTFSVNGANAGMVSSLVGAGFTSIENLRGGSAGDSFTFTSLGSLTGTVHGGSGADTVVGNDAGLTYTIGAADAGTVSAILPAGFVAVENLTGGGGADTFQFVGGSLTGSVAAGAGTDTVIGDDTVRTYTVTGTGAGTVSGVLPGGFSAVENLRGGSAGDTFQFGAAGQLAGTVNGGAGSDTLVGNDSGVVFTLTGPDAGTVTPVLPAGFTSIENLTGGTGADTFQFVGGSLAGAVVGGGGADTLAGDDGGRTFTVTGADAGTLSGGLLGGGFSGVPSLRGGAGADQFVFLAGGSLTGTIHGGAGADILTGTDAGLTYTIGGADAGTVSAVLSAGFVAVENLVAGAGADTFALLTGGSLTGTAAGGGGNDTLVGPAGGATFVLSGANAGSVAGLLPGFTNVETVLGGTGADILTLQPGGSLAGPFDGGAGTDTVNLSALGTQALALTALGAIDGFTLSGVPAVAGGLLNVDAVVGSPVGDALAGRDAAATWTVTGPDAGAYADDATGRTLAFAGFESLVGGSEAELFRFTGGSLTGTVAGGGGSDAVAGDDTARIYTLTGANAGTVGTLLPAGFTDVENLRGGSAADVFQFGPAGSLAGTVAGGAGLDTLIGTDVGLTFTVTGADAGTVSTILPAGFTEVENLTGGTGADAFQFNVGGNLTGAIAGGTGADLLVGDDAARTFNVSGTNAGSVASLLPAGFTAVENLRGGSAADVFAFTAAGNLTGTVDGGGGADTLAGNGLGLTFTVTGADAGTVSTVLPGGFTAVENLAAGSGTDAFQFNAGGSLTGSVDGGGGSDTVIGDDTARTFNASGTNAGTVSGILPGGFTDVENLRGGSAADTFAFGAAGSLTGTVNGGAGGDTLVGNDTGLTFTVAGADVGTVSTVLPGGFVAIENLTGGTGADTFQFTSPETLSGTIDGRAGTDTLIGDDAARTFTVSGANAGSVGTLLPAGFTAVENLRGGSAGDTFAVGAGGSLAGTVDGGAGSDTLVGNDSGLVFTLTGPDAGTVTPVLPAGFSSIENLTGGTGADNFQLAGGSLTGTVHGGAGSDTLLGDDAGRTFAVTGANAGSVTGVLPGFTGVETVRGGTGADSVALQPGGTLAGPFDGGAGADTVNLSALGAQTLAATALGPTDGFALGGVPAVAGGLLNVNAVTGSPAADSLAGRDVAATWTVTGPDAGTYSDSGRTLAFTAVETLAGGAAADLFQFTGGSLTGTVDGGAGTDTLAGDNAVRIFTVSGANAGSVRSLVPAGFANVENLRGGFAADTFAFGAGGSLAGTVTGGAGADVLQADNAGRTFTLSGADAGTVGGLAAFAGVENLRGGTGADTLVALPDGLVTGAFDGGDGLDTADLSARSEAQVVTLQSAGRTGYAALVAGIGQGRGLDRVIAPAGTADRLTGPATAGAWQVRAGADQSFYRQASTGYTLRFAGFERLTGGAAADTFAVDFSAGAPVGTAGLVLDGAGGTDALTVLGTAAADALSAVGSVVAVNGRTVGHAGIERLTLQAGDGADRLVVGLGLPAGLTLVELFGGAGDDFAQVVPSPTARVRFDGGVGTDRLRVDVSQSGLPLFVPPPQVTAGTYLFNTRQPVDFASVEQREFGPLI